MERWTVHVLRHTPTGQYYGRMADHVKTLRQAWRWYSPEELETWLTVSIYAPADKDNYQPVEAEIMMEVAP